MQERRILWNLLIFVTSVLIFFLCAWPSQSAERVVPVPVFRTPVPPPEAYEYSIFRTGPYEVAKVLGRSSGCQNSDAEFIELVNNESVSAGLDPRIAAATIAVESNCDSYAVSSRGALGEMQIMASIWKKDFDFAGDINLLNPRDNIQVGTKIMAGLIQDYGVYEGIRRYNGLGVGCATCDPGYTDKILSLSGRK